MLQYLRPKASHFANSWQKLSKASYSVHPDPGRQFYFNRVLDTYAKQDLNILTLRQLVFFGRNLSQEKILTSANYVRRELPIRLARRIRDFQNLPFIIGTNPHIENVYKLYWKAFNEIKKVRQIDNLESNKEFCLQLGELLNEHTSVIPELSLGMAESARYLKKRDIDEFMKKCIFSRISRRVLVEQHVALTDQWQNRSKQDPNQVGIVSSACDARSIVEKCSSLALDATHSYLDSRDFVIPTIMPKIEYEGYPTVKFAYINDHIEFVLFELFKNTFRAAYYNMGKNPDPKHPSALIKVTLSEGRDEVTFRISDQAGGIPISLQEELWSFAKSNDSNKKALSQTKRHITKIEPSSVNNPHVDDLGIGLPLCKTFVEFFGGSLDLVSLPGWGTDVYVKIPKLGTQPERMEFDAQSPEP
ncbi:alpha-ketoacid dehydrogenase kinase [Conidiobolus coronatus NRRL 28638]|uniref:Protein-serine/threonine kinase n=1 Tax=Conidiobolus coronatus (strain ATCC 28846 / CBS 209.66 / NRRL 28638) TaxID=796925 RepID=A0A137PG54_CONC2|nr:alpha-ketoacid dehydrogenase kinase [Conidiobolus coronatus NRRL 28638]|eukprot:KXN73972.1 alpha-ketoacid dehydrogenase kinase [Conidiobolus coronatus NRRL 28638]